MARFSVIMFLLLSVSHLCALNRIISLSPSITETLFAVGAGNQVVGVTRYCKFPPEALKKKQVGGFLDTDMETIISLKPDMVFLIDTDINNQKKLKQAGISFTVMTQTSVAGIERTIKKIGDLTGHNRDAKTLLGELNRKKNVVTVREKKPKVLLVAGRDAGSLKNIYVAGNKGFYDEIIRMAGCENAFQADFPVAYPSISIEGLLLMNPDIIIELVDDLRTKSIKNTDISKDWQQLPYLEAVKNKRIYYLVKDYATVPGPRIFNLIEDIRGLSLKK